MPEWKREGIVHSCPEVDISFLNRRPEYAAWQLDQVQALGIPLHFSTTAEKVTETDDKVVVHTDKGDFEADVCVAADGIGSKVPWPVPGGLAAVVDSGYAVARVAFPKETIKKGSPAEAIIKSIDEDGPQFRTYVGGADVSLIIFLTTDYVAWAFSHEADALSAESWHNNRDPEDIIEIIEKSSSDWDPAILDFVRQTPGKVVDWRLKWRDSIEQWTSDKGRIIKVGDSAHAFFPTAGNGAVQAQEDGISLAECLHQAGTKENIPWATRVHNALRFQRVSILQQTGFVNRDELHNSSFDENASAPDGEVPPEVGFFKIGRWVWDHNPEDYARRSYQKCLEHVRDGKNFHNTNIPPGHVFKSWTLESEYKRMAEGGHSGLKENGYWGL
ncbi:hypothetical protein M409DRAFT_51486 [Zasmidium cellare ATCC 36951]|uniref:FAD-binding domain-containing protein n=1 Tax=Zasmidium cellare ATCC 36951 TaxID=1080233 RepID=A0A6A6CTR9_ZASCE|nr:uncharacterized protein M409DRAFT_51486 [Zasmidium cellare ATCC 36951]KAF2170445.1 hypothetical protein M409DRAFT_51486 [Zasmidium cellare ATCC 36951]